MSYLKYYKNIHISIKKKSLYFDNKFRGRGSIVKYYYYFFFILSNNCATKNNIMLLMVQ